MEQRTLVITQELKESYLQKIKEIIPDWQIIVGKDQHVWQHHLKDAEIIAGWKKAMAENLDSCAKLSWVQTWSAGINSLPLGDLESRKIFLTNASGVHAFPISETIFALMLSLTRKIHTYVRNQASRTWHHSNLKLEMHGKTIAVVGVGAIGKETAKIAKAFGMKVLGVRRSGKPEEFVDKMYTLWDLDEILPRCDYIVVTLPLTNDTRHLFGVEQFKLMKPTSFFINIGRGEIAVEKELLAALQEDEIAGAGLDVFETEPLPEDSPLWELDNVIITPHTAGSTEHYDDRLIEDIFIPNLKEYINGNNPSVNLIDYAKGY